ncbi:MAG: hypothetical protein ABW221_03720 [Vicinamibacteria bacterium]
MLTLVLMAAAAGAAADEVWLKGGGRLVGDVISETGGIVVLEVGPGTVKLPRARVERIVSTTVALTEYRERAARLTARDAAGWTALAQWAEQKDLPTQAREAWRHVLVADPGNAVAHSALGDVLHQGRWMDFASVQRARGLVEHDGVWMSAGEREASIRRDAAEAGARQQAAIADSQRQEAEARVREAEARARTAEAEAARAEADASASVDGGIPLGYGIGGPVVVGPGIQPCCGLAHAPGYCPHAPGRPRNGNGQGNGGPSVQPTPRPPSSDHITRRGPSAKSNERGAGGSRR